MKKSTINISKLLNIRIFIKLVIICIIAFYILANPKTVADGVKNGLTVIGNELIPALFPFMVLAKYISSGNISQTASRFCEKPSHFIFRTNGNGITAFILGALGGYPVGAKTVSDFYKSGKITKNEAERLFYWCINPSPSFTITAVGAFMLGSIRSGVMIYTSCLLASLTVGICCRFLWDKTDVSYTYPSPTEDRKNVFIASVTDSTEAMLAVCGWVLTFSALSAVAGSLPLSDSVNTFINSVLEVTLGCKTAVSSGFSLPIISSLVSFGGFAVLFQAGAYADFCGIKMSRLFCSRLINSALSGIYTSLFIKIFPQSTSVYIALGGTHSFLKLYHSIPATVILLFMCAVLILEVDNRKKVW